MKVSIWLNKRKAEIMGITTILLVWQIASLTSGNALLPSPFETIVKTKDVILSSKFLNAVTFTTLRGLSGFFISAILGISLGYLSGRSRFFERFNRPSLNIIKATPVMSIIILLIIWFDSNVIPVVVSFLVSYPIVYSNVLQGTRAIDKNLVEMADVYNISHKNIFIHIYVPGVAPYILAGLSTAMGIGWKAVIAAEVLLQPRYSIGVGLIISKQNLDFAMVFSWTLVAVLLSHFFEKLIRQSEDYLIRWRKC